MFTIALLGLGLQAVVSIAVGLRLLGLARRTRRFPEAALSVQTLLPALSYPAILVAVVLEQRELPGVAPVFFVALSVMVAAVAMNYFFTWRVFRPHDTWAVILCGVGIWLLFAPVGGIAASIHANGIDAGMRGAPFFTASVVAAAISGFAWTALESFRYFLSSRRRLRLGLVEAPVCNRFLLWALASGAWLAVAALSAVLLVLGLNPLKSGAFTLGLGAGGLLNSTCFLLCFMPPQPYLTWLHRRAAALQAA